MTASDGGTIAPDSSPERASVAVATPAPVLSIVMPIFNERRTLRSIVGRVLASPVSVPMELVAVDDGSTDGSAALLAELAEADPRIQVVRHDRNRGKGAAIRTAIGRIRGGIAVVQDADLEYDPADLPRLVRPILEGRADAVFGSRFLAGEYRRVLYFWHAVGNAMLTTLANASCDLTLTDLTTGSKAVRADILRQTPIRSNGFAFEAELTVRLAQWGARIFEVPVSYAGRTYVEGKKAGWLDGLRAASTIARCRWIDPRFTTHDGYSILTAVRKARAFNRWMFDRIAPFLGRRVLEAGCGIGNLTERLLEADRLIAVDDEPLYVEMIGRRFEHLENVRAMAMDLTSAADYEALAADRLDTIVCLNVLEHIAEDEAVLQHFYRVLEPGGRAIILVPQHPWLYAPIDEALGHARRYTAEDLRAKLQRAGFTVEACRGFNALGMLGWLVSGKLLRRRRLSPSQMKVFNLMMPIARLVEHVPGWPALSVIAVGRKPG